ncbi:MAG: hypothetical protein KGZ65_06370, partial [Sphingomonadales bacterium]|nr:hypothetical protein [Sphingomonadaceae bacterium]MBS3930843.1 hypothetical protein [Sphingomonadales bacterium]
GPSTSLGTNGFGVRLVHAQGLPAADREAPLPPALPAPVPSPGSFLYFCTNRNSRAKKYAPAQSFFFPPLPLMYLSRPAPKLPPLLSPVKKAARVETRASHQTDSQGSLL